MSEFIRKLNELLMRIEKSVEKGKEDNPANSSFSSIYFFLYEFIISAEENGSKIKCSNPL